MWSLCCAGRTQKPCIISGQDGTGPTGFAVPQLTFPTPVQKDGNAKKRAGSGIPKKMSVCCGDKKEKARRAESLPRATQEIMPGLPDDAPQVANAKEP